VLVGHKQFSGLDFSARSAEFVIDVVASGRLTGGLV